MLSGSGRVGRVVCQTLCTKRLLSGSFGRSVQLNKTLPTSIESRTRTKKEKKKRDRKKVETGTKLCGLHLDIIYLRECGNGRLDEQ